MTFIKAVFLISVDFNERPTAELENTGHLKPSSNVFLQELDDDSIKFLKNTAKRHEGQVAEVS